MEGGSSRAAAVMASVLVTSHDESLWRLWDVWSRRAWRNCRKPAGGIRAHSRHPASHSSRLGNLGWGFKKPVGSVLYQERGPGCSTVTKDS